MGLRNYSSNLRIDVYDGKLNTFWLELGNNSSNLRGIAICNRAV